MVVQIDTDDRVRASFGGELNDVESNAAGAEHGDAFADGQLSVVVDHAERRSDSAAEQRAALRIEIGRNFGDAVLGNHRIIAEGGNPAGIDFGETFGLIQWRGGLKTNAFAPMADYPVA